MYNDNYKIQTHIIETVIYDTDYIKLHEIEVDRYVNDGWMIIETYYPAILSDKEYTVLKTRLEKYIQIPQRGLRNKCKPIDDACNLRSEIKELIEKYKYNVSITTTALYEEFLKDLEELVR